MAEPAPSASSPSAAPPRVPLVDYVVVFLILLATGGALVSITRAAPSFDREPRALLQPVFSMVLLTAIVWLGMAFVRNGAVALGVASVRYYATYDRDAPPDWIERPARAFNNLMEIPMLFYVLAALELALHRIDSAEVTLAWLFVGSRVVHAAVYVLWNRVSIRFAAYTAGCVTLAVMWARFAASTL